MPSVIDTIKNKNQDTYDRSFNDGAPSPVTHKQTPPPSKPAMGEFATNAIRAATALNKATGMGAWANAASKAVPGGGAVKAVLKTAKKKLQK